MLEAALEYLKHGFSIFPCGVRSRKPHPEWSKGFGGWGPLQNRLPTEEEVRAWWTKWPHANIAIVTGRISGIVVVDVDAQHGGTSEGLPPTGCISRTGQGGEHRLYRYPPGAINIPNQVNSEKARDPQRRGKDVRADGGYIVAAPSIHDKTGKRYTWESFEPASLGDAPEWALTPAPVEPNEAKEPWLTKLIEQGTAPGQRNDDLARFAGYWASVGVPLDVGLAITQMWIERQDLHDWGPSELETTVRSVYRTEARRNPERAHRKKPNRNVFATLSLRQFMRKYGDHEIRWSVEDWLPESTIAFLISPPGGYKTWLTFDLAVSIASGQPFLGKYPVREPGPVLVVQQEDFNSQTAERHALIIMNRLNLGKPEITDEDLCVPLMPSDRDLPLYYHADRMLRFDDTEVMDAVEDFVKSVRPKLVIVDPLYSATTTDEYMVKAASDMSRLKTMRDVYGTSFLVVHHTKKSAGFERLDAWGSQFINAFMETGWHVRRPEGEKFIGLKRHFKLADVQKPVKLTFDISSDDYRYAVTTEEISAEELDRILQGNGAKTVDGAGPPKGVAKRVLEVLATTAEGMTVGELALEVNSSEDKVSDALRALLRRGDVREDAIGRWTHAVPAM